MGEAEGDGGVPNGAMLVNFVEAIAGVDEERLKDARSEVSATLDTQDEVEVSTQQAQCR